MEKESIKIAFNYPLDESGKSMHLEAIAEPVVSKSYFHIHSFRLHSTATARPDNNHILPPIEIKHVAKEGKTLWVHQDSEKESHLSTIIGKAIEQKQYTGWLKKV